ncbi:MAG: DUF167 domain-containing protein [Rhodospirillales bacterium]|nr:DUF167 domain-containing protein [Rhodospirillales bacterium]
MAAAFANSPLSPATDGLRLRVHVTPRAAVDRVGEIIDDGRGSRLRVSVNAPPHDGKANAAVIRLLARTWRLPKTTFAVVAGASGRDKVIAILGNADALAAKIDVGRGTAAGNRSRGGR